MNGLKWCDFYVELMMRPGDFFENWAKENVPAKLVAMIPAAKQTSATTESIEKSWKGLAKFQPEPEVPKIAADLSQFMSSRVFERYCHVFQGPISGSLAAEFYHEGETWWNYWVEIQGELILRYPKEVRGDSVALTGEFRGHATSFRSLDKAIPVLFRKLSQGTVFKTVRVEPPTPAAFRVPVRGQLAGDTIRLELQNATVDFDKEHAKVTPIMLPVLSMRIKVQKYDLPYKGARFMLGRATDDAPAEFKVQRAGKTMVIERKFHRVRNTALAKGTHDLSVKACNPSCSQAGSSGSPARPM